MSEKSTEPVENKNNFANSNSEKKQGAKDEAWGYDLYPERRGTFSPKISNILIGKEGKESMAKYKCEKHVYDCVMNSKCQPTLHHILKIKHLTFDGKNVFLILASVRKCAYHSSQNSVIRLNLNTVILKVKSLTQFSCIGTYV